MYDKIVDFILDKILPKYIQETMNLDKDFYSVVTGGRAVENCLGTKFDEEHINHSDIDLMFVLLNNDINLLKKVHQCRMKLLHNIVNDYQLTQYLDHRKLQIKIDSSLLYKKNYEKYYVKLVRLKIDDTHIMDTSIYTETSIPSFGLYGNCYDSDIKLPIPFKFYNEIPYATCHYIYFDTFRMIVYYHTLLNERVRGITKISNKYIGYLFKFIALHNQYKNKYKDFLEIRKRILKTELMTAKTIKIKNDEKEQLLSLLDILEENPKINNYHTCMIKYLDKK